MRLGIRGISDVLLLYSGINKSRAKMILIIVLGVDTDALRKDYLHPLTACAISKMNQIGSFARFLGKKFQLTAEILIIGIFAPL